MNATVTLFSAAGEVVGSNSFATTDAGANTGGSNPALLLPFSINNQVDPAFTDTKNLYDSVFIELQWCATGPDYYHCSGGNGARYFLRHYTSDNLFLSRATFFRKHRHRRQH
jgi:hypothetical protein